MEPLVTGTARRLLYVIPAGSANNRGAAQRRDNKGVNMANLLRYVILLALWGFWSASTSFAGPDQQASAPAPSPSFEADLIRIDGDRYVVKDIAGAEQQGHVGKDTEIFGRAKVGDRIQLWVQPDGHAQAIVIVRSGPQ